MNDTMLIKKNLKTLKKSWLNFTSFIQTNHASANLRWCYINQSIRILQIWVCEIMIDQSSEKKTTFMQTWIFKERSNVTNVSRSNFNQFIINVSELIAYWLELVNDLVEIWSRFDQDLTQHLFRFSASFIQFLLSSK